MNDQPSVKPVTVRGLPTEVRQLLFAEKTFETYYNLVGAVGGDKSQIPKLLVLFSDVLTGREDIHLFPTKLSELFSIDETKGYSLAVQLMTGVLMQVDDLFQDLDFQALTREWSTKDDQEEESAEEFAHTYVEQMPGKKDERSSQRLEDVFTDLAEGDLTHDEAASRLAKSPKVGGLGIDPTVAESVVDVFETEMKGKVFLDDVPVNRPPSKPNQPQKPQIEAFTEEDEKEIEQIKQEKEAALTHEPITSIEGVVKRVCEDKRFQFDNPVLTERCQKVVHSRVRGVRDAFATRRQLERSVEQGGVGVTGRSLAEMTQLLEQAVEEYHAHAGAQIEQEKEQAQKVKEAAASAEEQRQVTEQKVMDKRFVELTGKTPRTSVSPTGPKRSRTSAAVSAQVETQQREGKIDVARVKTIIEASQAAAPKSAPRPKPKRVQDVVFEKRLSGPVEELKRLTLTDFRRLSSDPVQATTKIKDKVDLLENLGYEQKVEGIKAWRSSPLNRLYIELAEQAVLSGTTIQAALESQQERGVEMFKDEELKAVMKLNADLRF